MDAEEKAKKEAEEKARLAAEEKQKEMEAKSQAEQGTTSKAEKKTSGEAKGQVNGARKGDNIRGKNPKGDKAGEKQQNGEEGLPAKGSLWSDNDVTNRNWCHFPSPGSWHGSRSSRDKVRIPFNSHPLSSTFLQQYTSFWSFSDALDILTK